MSETTTDDTASAPAEDPTPFGWLNTADHKRVGRLFIVTSTLFLGLGALLLDHLPVVPPAPLGGPLAQHGLDLARGDDPHARQGRRRASIPSPSARPVS